MRILRDSTRKCVAVLTVAALLAIFGLNAQAGIILPGGLVGNDLTDPEDDGSLAGTVTYSAQKNDTEGALKAFDNSASTKWYTTSSTPMPHFITF
ncbi:MAG: hypothetical protein HN350_00395, partial [Phycisphaerales bacterium]|nr:hypothetical protein [Phycisphaerales bacterium]